MLYYILGMFTVLIPPDNLRPYKCLFSIVIRFDCCRCCKDLRRLLQCILLAEQLRLMTPEPFSIKMYGYNIVYKGKLEFQHETVCMLFLTMLRQRKNVSWMVQMMEFMFSPSQNTVVFFSGLIWSLKSSPGDCFWFTLQQ